MDDVRRATFALAQAPQDQEEQMWPLVDADPPHPATALPPSALAHGGGAK